MSSESIKEKLAKLPDLPGLFEWQNRTVLLYRCRDIDRSEFLERIQNLHQRIEALYNEALPESMDEETYLVAQEYYDAVSEGLDCYLNGLEDLMSWAQKGDPQLLQKAQKHFTQGDSLSREITTLAFETQENFREMDEAILKTLRAT